MESLPIPNQLTRLPDISLLNFSIKSLSSRPTTDKGVKVRSNSLRFFTILVEGNIWTRSCRRHIPALAPNFSTALYISHRKKQVEEINKIRLDSLNVPIARIDAIDTPAGSCPKDKMEELTRLPSRIYMAVGSRVILRQNICVKK